MKIWICGASGMLGSHFKRLLTKTNRLHIATGRSEIDVTDLDSVSDFVRVQKISHIINCSAYTNVDKAEEEQKQAYQINALGPHHLGIAARRHGARLLHFSTDYIFDGNSRTPYPENYFTAPLNAYGLSKLAGEMKLQEELKRCCIIRTSWLFGYPGKNFVATMLRLMENQETLKVVSDQLGRPTYAEDLAEAAVELLDAEGIYHFANAYETSWYAFAKEIHAQAIEMGFPVRTEAIVPISSSEYTTLARRPMYSTLSTKKIEGLLGRTPRPWTEALADYLCSVKQTALLSPSCSFNFRCPVNRNAK